MNRRSGLKLLFGLLLGTAALSAAQDDPGKTVVGKVRVTVYYATNGDPAAAGPRFKEIPKEIESRFP